MSGILFAVNVLCRFRRKCLAGVLTLIALRLTDVFSLRALVKQNAAANAGAQFLREIGRAASDGGSGKTKSMSARPGKGQFSHSESGIGGAVVHRSPDLCGCFGNVRHRWVALFRVFAIHPCSSCRMVSPCALRDGWFRFAPRLGQQ
jgi:hypothetical protein